VLAYSDYRGFLMTALGGRLKPEIYFLPKGLRWTLLHKERYGDSYWPWIEHPTFRLRLPKFIERSCAKLHYQYYLGSATALIKGSFSCIAV